MQNSPPLLAFRTNRRLSFRSYKVLEKKIKLPSWYSMTKYSTTTKKPHIIMGEKSTKMVAWNVLDIK